MHAGLPLYSVVEDVCHFSALTSLLGHASFVQGPYTAAVYPSNPFGQPSLRVVESTLLVLSAVVKASGMEAYAAVLT